MKTIDNLKVQIFSDGADKESMLSMYSKPYIKGLTTNPTLMRKAGVENYKDFCLDILRTIKDKPISFEVFSDDFDEMYRQAIEISSWGGNVYVKIPISNTKGIASTDLIHKLTKAEVKVNVTAVMTLKQVNTIIPALNSKVPNYISIFAGRIADTGRDPLPILKSSLQLIKMIPSSELIWASPRELLNIFQANEIGCHVITVTNDILAKLKLVNYDLDHYSLDTVRMFHTDALAASFHL
jgi:transaldolase